MLFPQPEFVVLFTHCRLKPRFKVTVVRRSSAFRSKYFGSNKLDFVSYIKTHLKGFFDEREYPEMM